MRLLSDFRVKGLSGKVPKLGMSRPPKWLSHWFDLDAPLPGGLDLSLEGEINIQELNVSRKGAETTFELVLRGGDVTGGRLGANDLSKRLHHAFWTAFWTAFASVLLAQMAVLGFLVARDWDPCTVCSEKSKESTEPPAAETA